MPCDICCCFFNVVQAAEHHLHDQLLVGQQHKKTMKKKVRRLRTSERMQQTGKVQTAADVSEEKMPFSSGGKLWKTVTSTAGSICPDSSETEKTADLDFSLNKVDDAEKHPESKSRSSGEQLRMNSCSSMNFVA